MVSARGSSGTRGLCVDGIDRPLLYPSSRPSLFSLTPSLQPDGVWLVLAFDPEDSLVDAGDTIAVTTPQSLATKAFPLLSRGFDDEATPRDRWLRRVGNRMAWQLGKRFSFRVNWAPNFAIDVTAHVHTARSMLASGSVDWKANEEDMERLQREQERDPDGEQAEVWPCPRLYVHIAATETGIAIPARRESPDPNSTWAWSLLMNLAEAYMGGLTVSPDQGSSAPSPIPVHLVLERVYVGVVPHASLALLAVLVSLITVAVVCILPRVSRAMKAMAGQERIKEE